MRVMLLLVCGGALALSACAQPVPKIAYDNPQPAHLLPSPPAPVQVVTLPEPLPLPGQLKKLPLATAGRPSPQPANPVARVALANAAARINPTRDGYINAMQVFPWSDGAPITSRCIRPRTPTWPRCPGTTRRTICWRC